MEKRKSIILKIIFVLIGIMVILTFFSNTIHNLNVAGVVVAVDTSGDITTIHRGTATLGYTEKFYTHWAEQTGRIQLLVDDEDTVQEGDLLFTIHTKTTEDADFTIIPVVHTQYAVVGGVVRLSPDMEDRAPVIEGQPILQLAERQGHHFEFAVYFPGTFVPEPRGVVTRNIEITVPTVDRREFSGDIESIAVVDGDFRVEFSAIVPGAVGGERVNVVIEDIYSTRMNHLPNEAIREDTRGEDFILIARQVPNTLLGYSYFAERVEIEVTLRGDQFTVFDMRYELDAPVILQSDRPIEEGDRVRMVGER